MPSKSDMRERPVKVLQGEFKGEVGHVIEKNREKETVRVQLSEEAGLQIVELCMDDVCLCSH